MGIGTMATPDVSFTTRYITYTASDAFAESILAAIFALICCLFILLPTWIMNMKAKDRAVVSIMSFMFAFINYFIIKFLGLMSMNYITEIISVILMIAIPIMIETFVYNRVLTYKKIKGLPLALITNFGAVLIYISVAYLASIVSRI